MGKRVASYLLRQGTSLNAKGSRMTIGSLEPTFRYLSISIFTPTRQVLHTTLLLCVITYILCHHHFTIARRGEVAGFRSTFSMFIITIHREKSPKPRHRPELLPFHRLITVRCLPYALAFLITDNSSSHLVLDAVYTHISLSLSLRAR